MNKDFTKITHAWIPFLILLLAVGCTKKVFAFNPKKTINQYGHTTWLLGSGLPANSINVVIQTLNGYLWLDITTGLFRFDGVNFTEIITNPNNTRDMRQSPRYAKQEMAL